VTLPLAYFQARRVGDSVARVRELENIRSFLTGNAITLILDVLFSVVFVAVMFFYSGWLTLVVVVSLPLYFVISWVITPLLRARLQESFSRGAENQAFLVETVNGIDTLKAMAAEPQIHRKWDNQLAGYVAATFRTQTLSMLANESVGLVGKLVTVATLWVGARLAMDGQLSVGQLVAFNMLAGRVAQPILRLAQLWTNFQQTGVSIQRLGDILNTRTESSQHTRSTLPRLAGNIELDQVHFRYRADGSEVLRGISIQIKSGEIIGVVGRSGSGKSTLTRLIQRLYTPERGRVLVDGMDLALAEVASLRRQIGVVLQDNMLFNRRGAGLACRASQTPGWPLHAPAPLTTELTHGRNARPAREVSRDLEPRVATSQVPGACVAARTRSAIPARRPLLAGHARPSCTALHSVDDHGVRSGRAALGMPRENRCCSHGSR
jgi:subfamily B ATP-binding cassette protein HlyB/CyaB